MDVRDTSKVVFVASALALGLYACVGDDPGVGGNGGDDDSGAGSDASASDATQTGDTSTISTDGSPGTDAGNDAAPPQVTRAFVSSAKYFGGSIGGLATADTDCQELATAASRGLGWKAWLSTSTSNAKDHVLLGNSPITLVDGVTVVVAHGTDLIADGGIEHAIDHDETNTAVAATLVWTGTTPHGLISAGPGTSCHDWAIEDGGGLAGGSNQTLPTWTDDGFIACSMNKPIYCFGP
jgi:hypothetical protein